MDQKWDVIIIGGGIIGVSTAYFLAKQNLKVLVLEKNKIGQGCSYGNAGWLTPCFAMPLPMPGMFLKSLKWLLDSNSPLYIKPSLHPDLIFWLLRFLKSMNQKQATRSIEALVQLSQRSLILTKELTEKPPHPTFFQQKGLMMLATSPEGLNDIYLEQKLMSALGVESEKLSTEQCIQREGLLNPNRIIGGVHFLNEATAEPYETVVHLQKKAEALGAIFLENHEVIDKDLEIRSDGFLKNSQSSSRQAKVKSVQVTTKGQIYTFHAKQFVLTPGSWSLNLGKKWDLSLPILGGKGYSMTTEELSTPLTLPIMYLEKKVALTPRKSGFRLAGTLELVKNDFSISHHRVQNIINGTREILNINAPLKTTAPWVGLRPCSPDGVPLIGPSGKYSNVYCGLGHQMLGFQTGIATGELLSQMMTEQIQQKQDHPFNPGRFTQ